MEPKKILELGAWTGKSQTLRMVASHCTAADAECLKQIKDTHAYKAMGYTWEKFCSEHLHLHRTTAEDIIRRFDEFGPVYFKLAELMHISPRTWQEVESSIIREEECVEIRGDKIPIKPEFAARLRRAIFELINEQELKKKRRVEILVERLQNDLTAIATTMRIALSPGDRFRLADALDVVCEHFKKMSRDLRK